MKLEDSKCFKGVALGYHYEFSIVSGYRFDLKVEGLSLSTKATKFEFVYSGSYNF